MHSKILEINDNWTIASWARRFYGMFRGPISCHFVKYRQRGQCNCESDMPMGLLKNGFVKDSKITNNTLRKKALRISG